MKQRNYSLDYLKIISICLIILFHYFWNAKYDWTQFSLGKRVVVDIFHMFGELGVDCFALISGYFLSASDKPFKFRKIRSLWCQVLLYSILSALAIHSNVKAYKFTLLTLLKIFLPVSYKVWWYVTAYFLLYCLSPYINKCIRSLSKAEYRRLLVILIGVFSIIPSVLGMFSSTLESFLFYNRFIWIVVLYCIAGYVQLHSQPVQCDICRKKLSQSAYWLLMHIALWVVAVAYIIIMEVFPGILGKDIIMDSIYFWPPNSVLMLAMAFSLFMFFKEVDIKGSKVVSFMSSTTLGLYMLHGGRSASFWWNRIFHAPKHVNSWTVFVDAFTALLTIICVGIIVEFVRQSIVRFATWIINDLRQQGENG